MAAEEAFGVAAVREGFEFVHHVHVEGFAGEGVVDGLAVDLGGAGDVVGAFGSAFDFQGVDAHVDQFGDVLDGAEVFGVHDVGAVFILVRGDEAAWAVGLFQEDFFWLEGFHGVGGGGDQVAGLVVAVLYRFVVPAAGVGAGALVGVAVVHVAGQQAAAGVGHAQRTVYEDFEFHFGDFFADLADFVQGQFPGQDDPVDALAAPELNGGPVDGVGLD